MFKSVVVLSGGLLLATFSALPVAAEEGVPMEIQQQQITAKGIVTDESGEPLIGVTIKVKGTANGTVTDQSGRFSINVASNAILQFSYIGYKSVELKAQRGDMRVMLNSDSELIDEVVVVAYGKQKKVTVTGAVAAINGDEVLKSPAPNVEATLAGRIPGLTAIQGSGEPGRDDVTFYLRGVGTTNGQAPLILVDGVPRDDIATINSHEIETVSVLKDASATAVFGVRGANGVILITTKRGAKGKVNVSGTVEYSLQGIIKRPNRLDSYDMALLRNEALRNDGLAEEYSQEDIDAYYSWRTGNPTDPFGHPNNDFFDIIFKDYAPQTRANLDVSGGSEKTQYFISAGYLHQGGMFNVEDKSVLGYDPQSTMNRYNFRSNLDHQLNKNIKLSLDVSSFIEKINGSATTFPSGSSVWAIMPYTMAFPPTQPGPLTIEGYPLLYFNELAEAPVGGIMTKKVYSMADSPYGQLNRRGYKLETHSGLNAILNLDVDLGFITPGLSTKGLVSFESRGVNRINAYRTYAKYYLDELPDGTMVYQLGIADTTEDGQIGLSKEQWSNYFINMQWYLNYNQTFAKKHNVGGMLLFQRDYREKDGADLPYNVLGLSGRFTYNFDSKYLFEFNMGYNGSEQFSPDKRFGFFPAVSFGWVASEEKFIRDNAKWLTTFKVRGSYGEVGNDQMGSARFLYLDDISVSGKNPRDCDSGMWNIPSLGSSGTKYINYAQLGNPDITWEVAKKFNIGFDITVFKDLSATFDYFTEKRSDVLIGRQTIPDLQGLPSSAMPKVNMGKVENHGYEFTLSYNHKFNKDFAVNAGFNYSYSKNKVTEFDELVLEGNKYDENGNVTEYGYAYTQRATGFCIGQNWGYKIDHNIYYDANGNQITDGSGYFNSQENIEKLGRVYEIGLPSPGDFIYEDANGDGLINDKDLQPIGYSSLNPRAVYGITLGGQVKGFDISVLFQGIDKFSRNYDGWGTNENMGVGGAYFDDHLGRWSKERYEAGEKITRPRLGSGISHYSNDYWIMNASYLRLKNVEIGYTFPFDWTRHIGAQQVRLYVNGNNLLTWDHLRTNIYDPEQRKWDDGAGSYPVMRTFNVGLNVVF